jgi:hypothetical protein
MPARRHRQDQPSLPSGCLDHRLPARTHTAAARTLTDVESDTAPMRSRPAQWLVVWGQPGRSDWSVERVTAFDDEEALVRARELHPELGRPTAAFLARPIPGPWFPAKNPPEPR